MAATKYVIGKGSVFSISTDGTTFTPVKQIKTIQFSGGKSDTEDITNMDSTGNYREYAPTLLDAGQASVSGVFDPLDPGQLMFAAAFTGQVLVHCKLQYPATQGQTTGFLRTFAGWVTESNLDAQFDKTSTLAATIKVTGPFTDTAGV
jgi:predicted secreted protein